MPFDLIVRGRGGEAVGAPRPLRFCARPPRPAPPRPRRPASSCPRSPTSGATASMATWTGSGSTSRRRGGRRASGAAAQPCTAAALATPPSAARHRHRTPPQGAPLNESDHCGDPPLLLAAGNGAAGERAAVVAARVATRVPWLTAAARPTPAAPPGHLAVCKLLLEEGADIEQRNVVRPAGRPAAGAAAHGHRLQLPC